MSSTPDPHKPEFARFTVRNPPVEIFTRLLSCVCLVLVNVCAILKKENNHCRASLRRRCCKDCKYDTAVQPRSIFYFFHTDILGTRRMKCGSTLMSSAKQAACCIISRNAGGAGSCLGTELKCNLRLPESWICCLRFVVISVAV